MNVRTRQGIANSDSTNQANVELAQRVSLFLCGQHRAALRQLDVTACDGIVYLRGVVNSFHEKQLAHQCSRRVAGVVNIVDELRVEYRVEYPRRRTRERAVSMFDDPIAVAVTGVFVFYQGG